MKGLQRFTSCGERTKVPYSILTIFIYVLTIFANVKFPKDIIV